MHACTTILSKSEGHVRVLTLNRPERRNALNPVMVEELTSALLEAAADERCGVVILTGAGQSFCAGLDLDHLATMEQRTTEEHRQESEAIARLLRTLYELPRPTIAAVNGAAVAGGMGLATVCDMTLAVPEARFGYSEVKIGFIPAVVSAFLRTQIGDKRSRDLLLSGRQIKAVEALDLGLVTRIVPETELMEEARRLAVCLLRNSPAAMQATKRLMNEYGRAELDAGLTAAIAANAEARLTADFHEGVRSFLEKRTPEWPSLRAEKLSQG
ncbi:enoyl-CoA hydratase/isomerase family protein [Silvibacterium dinghuense]|uniref:Enoyl-CoA hydratase n=1 Tax=Silvibacterium dinghuense TaxID=1560006 RepID=A0A4V1NVF2_9BACT|nr:enoyl-CoA hydratase-related protein [Silvibacterium dinghuense]RXS95560.1 enoyl-CoA hydratase [Silvibacterium dinghuense]GGH14027.1 enoyl-CoA hydratase [Silvibacterium dinghuense]